LSNSIVEIEKSQIKILFEKFLSYDRIAKINKTTTNGKRKMLNKINQNELITNHEN